MANTESNNAISGLDQPKPAAPAKGQGISRNAETRRRRAVKKKAAFANGDVVPEDCETSCHIIDKAVDTPKSKPAPLSTATANTISTSITEADLAKSAAAPKKPLPVKNIVPASPTPEHDDKGSNKPYSGVTGTKIEQPGHSQRKHSVSSQSAISTNSNDQKKLRKPKVKPQADDNGWTAVPVIEQGEKDKKRSVLAQLSPSPSNPSRYDALREDQGKIDAKVAKSSRKTKKRTKSKAIASSATPEMAAMSDVDVFAASMSTGSWAKVAVAPPAVKTASVSDAPAASHTGKDSVVVAQRVPTQADFPSSLFYSFSQKTDTPPNNSYAKAAKSPPPSRSQTPTTPAAPASSTAIDVPPQPKSPENSRSPSPSPVVHQKFDNLLEMIYQEREGLLKGPRITIYVGDVPVPDISKRAAMAVSSVLNKHFTSNPESLEYRFSRGQLNPGAIRLLLVGWMQETCQDFEAYAVPAQQTFGEDVAVLRAARLLGMERYCRHVLTQYVEYLKTQIPSYEEIVAVEKNATSDKDPLWTAMVNHLCHDRFKGLIPDAEDFEAFLEKHPRLKKAMESADAFFAGYAKKQADIREAERRQRWEDGQAAKRERIAREQRAAESLRQKMETKSSGLMTVTADEAEMLRGRTRTR